jgi:periplasmic divalent cation tolerance protein
MQPTSASNAIEIQVTCATSDEASHLANTLIGRRLAACVHEYPIRSTYRWDGDVEHDEEIVLVVKTTTARYDAVEQLLLDEHSYDVPAITATPIVAGSAAYLEWIVAETS